MTVLEVLVVMVIYSNQIVQMAKADLAQIATLKWNKVSTKILA